MCHSGESSLGRTQPEPRKPSNLSASDVPACTQASISVVRDGSTWRVTDTVTGAETEAGREAGMAAGMALILRREGASHEAGGDEIPHTSQHVTGMREGAGAS